MKTLITVVLLALSCIAQTAKPREIDFSEKLIGLDNKPITNGGEKAEPATLGQISYNALVLALPTDKDLSLAEKLRYGKLAHKVVTCGKCTLSVSDTSLLIERIGKVYGVGIVSVAIPLLDPSYEADK